LSNISSDDAAALILVSTPGVLDLLLRQLGLKTASSATPSSSYPSTAEGGVSSCHLCIAYLNQRDSPSLLVMRQVTNLFFNFSRSVPSCPRCLGRNDAALLLLRIVEAVTIDFAKGMVFVLAELIESPVCPYLT
jgi:hypothetical protein